MGIFQKKELVDIYLIYIVKSIDRAELGDI